MAEKAKEQEKFKPLGPRDLTGDMKEIVEETDWYWLNHPVVELYHGAWEEYIAWFEGDQYSYYSTVLEKLVDVTPLVEREVKNVYNRILPMVRQQWGEIRYPHSFYVEPNTSESADKKAASMASALIEYTNVLRLFNHKINYAKLWALVTGNVFWKEWWNRKLYGFTEGKDGRPIKEPGDVDYNWVNPFNVRPDPNGKTRDEWRWLIEGKLTPKAEVEEEFGLAKGTLPAENIMRSEIGLFRRADQPKPHEEMIIRKERWARPTKNYPKGRFSVIAGGYLCYDGPSPAAADGDIPYFQLMGTMPILDEQWGDSSVRIGQNAQRQFNRFGSMIDEHIQNFKVKGMIPRNSMNFRDKVSFCRAGVDFVEFNPTGYGNPYFQSPPPLPEIIIRMFLFMENEMEQETSVRKTLQGQLPKYASRASGELFQGLVAQDQKVLYPAIEDQEVQLQAAMKYRLELMQKHYSLPRMVKITGKNKATSIAYIKGAEIANNTDVRIRSGVALMQSIEAKREVVSSMIQQNLITDPKKALELLDVKGIEEYMEDEYVDERQGQRIIELFKQGKAYIEVQPDDNHAVLYTVFNNFRKTEEFDTLPKDAQDKIQKRIDGHKAYLPEIQKATQLQPAVTTPAEAEVPAETGGAGLGAGAGAAGALEQLRKLPPEVVQEAMRQVAAESQGQGAM